MHTTTRDKRRWPNLATSKPFRSIAAMNRGGPLDLANAIRSFAVLKDEVGAAEEAQRLWQEAHDLYVVVNVPAGVAESAARLALLARHQGDLQRSREWFSEAMAAADATDDPETQQYIREVKTQIEN